MNRGDEYQYESWSDVRQEIEDCLRACPSFRGRTEVQGRLKRFEGLSHENFLFCVRDAKDDQRLDCFVYRRISPRGVIPQLETSEHLRLEAETLRSLKRIGCPFRYPEAVWVAADASRPRALIETAVDGYPPGRLARGGRAGYLIDQIADLAAQVHKLPKSEFLHLIHKLDSKEDLELRLKELPESFWRLRIPRRARQWIQEHAAAAPRRAVILHGDLLPPNLLFSAREDEAPAILDWEFAGVGDAAYDLAVITRAETRLFGVEEGRARLIRAYIEAGGQKVTEADVLAQELLLVAVWMWEAAESERRGRPAEGQTSAHYEEMLKTLLPRTPRD